MKEKLAIVAGAGMVVALAASPASPAAEYTGKVTPSLTVSVKPKRLTTFPSKLTISGAVVLPEGVTVADACSGKVAITIRTHAKKALFTSTTSVRSTCKYTLTLKAAKKLPKQTLSIVVSFKGNSALTSTQVKTSLSAS
jgi:hypothetical protein